MSILDTLARAWILRPGAQWRRETCGTCLHIDLYDEPWDSDKGTGFCWQRKYMDVCTDDTACPAWRRKRQ